MAMTKQRCNTILLLNADPVDKMIHMHCWDPFNSIRVYRGGTQDSEPGFPRRFILNFNPLGKEPVAQPLR